MQWLQESFSALTANEEPSASNGDISSNKRPSKLQHEGQLSRKQLLDFFQSASEIMQAEDFRRKLKDAKLLKQVLYDCLLPYDTSLHNLQTSVPSRRIDTFPRFNFLCRI